MSSAVIIEFDFAVFNGAERLFELTRDYLKKVDEQKLVPVMEARYLAGNEYQQGLGALFAALKSKKTAQKAARELETAFSRALNEELPAAVTTGFRNFVKALNDNQVKVVISTRADIDTIRPAFEPILGDDCVLYHEQSTCYGAQQWISWRRTCSDLELSRKTTLAIAGSGLSVKGALLGGFGAVGVMNDHVAYQDFGGASEILNELSGATAKRVLKHLSV